MKKRMAILGALALAGVVGAEAVYQLEVRELASARDQLPPQASFTGQVYEALARDTGRGDSPTQAGKLRLPNTTPAACRRLLDSLRVQNFRSERLADPVVQELLLGRAPCDMRMNPPKLGLDLRDPQERRGHLRLLLVVLGLSFGFVLTHKSRGWQRACVLLGIVGGGLLTVINLLNGIAVAVTVFEALLVAAVLASVPLLVREGVEWVRAGFRNDSA